MKFFIASALAAFIATPALAGGTHSGSDAAGLAVGTPGKKAEIDRTLTVELKETEDGDMIFSPDSLEVRRGETIEFKLVNVGELEHEFVLGSHDVLMKHKDEMATAMNKPHKDPNAARLQQGEKATLIWTFANEGNFEFACLIPGHYESGMKGRLAVVDKVATLN